MRLISAFCKRGLYQDYQILRASNRRDFCLLHIHHRRTSLSSFFSPSSLLWIITVTLRAFRHIFRADNNEADRPLSQLIFDFFSTFHDWGERYVHEALLDPDNVGIMYAGIAHSCVPPNGTVTTEAIFSHLNFSWVLEASTYHSRHVHTTQESHSIEEAETIEDYIPRIEVSPLCVLLECLGQASGGTQLNEYVEMNGSFSYAHKEPST